MKHDRATIFEELKWGEVLIVPLLSLILTVLLFVFNPIAGTAGLVITAFLAIHSYIRERDARKRILRAIEDLDGEFDEVTKNAIFSMPFAMAVLNGQGKFLWYNSNFMKTFHIEESLLNQSYSEVFPDISLSRLENMDRDPFRVEMNDKIYIFYNNVTGRKSGQKLILLYGIDNTEDEEIKFLYKNEAMVVASIFLDNYDEVRSRTPESDRPLVFAQIDRMVSDFASRYEAILIKYESDRYSMIFTRAGLEQMKNDRFPLLEDIKNSMKDSLAILPTASIGIGFGGVSPQENQEEGRAAIDIALARGGDQVVIKKGEDLEYYGGKNQATQRFTKVKARVMSNTLKSFVDQASDVLIMGHQNPDMDSLGSCLGMLSFVESLDKKGYIILDSVTTAIENLYDKILKEIPDADKKIILADRAMDYLNPTSLIVVLDNHRAQATACPELLDHGNRIIIIDHHRRGAGYIKEAEIAYIEPVASSTSEMVTELISYQSDMKISKTVAEALLAGITVDTKNFFYQTGARTFEAASFLKRHGADSIVIKELFKDDWDLMRYRSEIIADAYQWKPGIMIGHFNRDIEGASLIASQAADDLLNIRDVEASFVLTPSHGKIHISARSLGDISVQLIMEKIGGGGHLTASATQLDTSMEEAEAKLKEAISAYMEEEKNEGNPA